MIWFQLLGMGLAILAAAFAHRCARMARSSREATDESLRRIEKSHLRMQELDALWDHKPDVDRPNQEQADWTVEFWKMIKTHERALAQARAGDAQNN